jgi:hypothetical protein
MVTLILRYICGKDEYKDSLIEELLNHDLECGRDQVRMILQDKNIREEPLDLLSDLFAQRRQDKEGNFFDFLTLLTDENDSDYLNWLTNYIKKEVGQSNNMTTIHFIAQAGDFVSLKLLLNILKKSMMPEELVKLLNQEFEGDTALHFAAVEPITEDKLLVILELLASGVHGDIKNQFNETFLDGRPLLMQKLSRHLKTAQQDTIEALLDKDNQANIVKVNNDHVLFTLLKRGFDLNANRDPMVTIPLIWPNRENLPETLKLLCEQKVKEHKGKINAIKIGSESQMREEDFVQWIIEVKKQVPKTFGIGYYLSRVHKGFFIVFLLLGVFDFYTDIRLTMRYYTDFESITDKVQSPSDRKDPCAKLRYKEFSTYPAFHYMEHWHNKMQNRTSLDVIFLPSTDDILRCLSPGISCRKDK